MTYAGETVCRSPESNKVFKDLPASELAALRQAAQEKTYAPNQAIFKEGDPGDGMYIVKSGLVHISATVSGGDLRVPLQARSRRTSLVKWQGH